MDVKRVRLFVGGKMVIVIDVKHGRYKFGNCPRMEKTLKQTMVGVILEGENYSAWRIMRIIKKINR